MSVSLYLNDSVKKNKNVIDKNDYSYQHKKARKLPLQKRVCHLSIDTSAEMRAIQLIA